MNRRRFLSTLAALPVVGKYVANVKAPAFVPLGLMPIQRVPFAELYQKYEFGECRICQRPASAKRWPYCYPCAEKHEL